MDISDVPFLDGWLSMAMLAERCGVAKKTVLQWVFDRGMFPGVVQVTDRPLYLVPEDQVHLREQTGPLSREDVPFLPGWLDVAGAALLFNTTQQNVHKMAFDRHLFTTMRRLPRTNVLLLRENEAEVVHAKRVRTWAVSAGQDVIGVPFATLESAFRSKPRHVTL